MLPDEPGVSHRVFAAIAEQNIVVDMICQNVGSAGKALMQRRRRYRALLAPLMLGAWAMLFSPLSLGEAHAQRLLQIAGGKRSAMVTVAVGKTEDIRVDAPFTDITIGDSEVADISPMTDRTISGACSARSRA